MASRLRGYLAQLRPSARRRRTPTAAMLLVAATYAIAKSDLQLFVSPTHGRSSAGVGHSVAEGHSGHAAHSGHQGHSGPARSASVALHPEATSAPPENQDGLVGEAASAANLAKNIIGAGVLAVPAGAAQVVSAAGAAGIEPNNAYIGVAVMVALAGALNAFGFCLIGEVCARTGARTYQAAWTKTFGDSLAWVPAMASLVCCLTGAVACVSVIGDTAAELLGGLVGMRFDEVVHDGLRCGISGAILLPLCLLPSLAPLAFASVLGLVGVTILAAVMVVRCLDGSYLPDGALHEAAALKPEIFRLPEVQNPQALADGKNVLVQRGLLFAALLSNAFCAHYNAPSTYSELEDPDTREGTVLTSPARKLSSFGLVTVIAFAFSAVLLLVVTLTGLMTFGAAVQPLVLNNYADTDSLALIARVGLGVCVLFQYPLLERCFRATAAELLGLPASAANQPAVVTASVAGIAALACVPGLGLEQVSAVGGAIGGSLLIYIAPALMLLRLREESDHKESTEDDLEARPVGPGQRVRDAASNFGQGLRVASQVLEASALRAIAAFGTTLGGLGVVAASETAAPLH